METRKQLLIAGVLMVVVVIVWIWALTTKPIRPGRAVISKGDSQSMSRGIEVQPPESMSPEVHPPFTSRYAEWGDSPFQVERHTARVSLVGGVRSQEYILSGILWDPKTPSAIVDQQVVVVGDRLDGWRVVDIRKDGVTLSDGKTIKELSLE